MSGTSFSVTFAILLIPPTRTIKARAEKIKPEIHSGAPVDVLIIEAI